MGKKIIKRKRKTSGRSLPYDPYNVNITSSNPTTDQSAWIDKKKSNKSVKNKKQRKTINDMHVADLRVLARRYNVPSAGIKKSLLKRRIKSKMRDIKISDTSSFINTEEGSRTEVVFPDKQFNVTVIDVDVEPHTQVKTQRLGEGMYDIKQETVLGEEESVLVTVSHTDPKNSLGIQSSKKSKGSLTFMKKRKDTKQNWYPAKPYDIPPSLIKKVNTKPRTESGKKTQSDALKELKEQEKLRQEYFDKGKIYYYYSRATGSAKDVPTTKLVPLTVFDEKPEVKYLVEKPGLLERANIKASKALYVSTDGNNLQNVFDKELKWIGIIDQKSAKNSTPLPHLAKAEFVIVDNDDGGHYIAYMNNLYMFNDPLRKNVLFVDNDGTVITGSADEFQAKRFWGKNFANSAAFRRNKIVPEIIKEILLPTSESKIKLKSSQKDPLKYRDMSGKITNFEITDQKMAISKFIHDPEASLFFDCAETTVTIPISADKDLAQELSSKSKVKLKFIPDKSLELKPLTSDDIITLMVTEKQIDSITAQITLENLYHAGWINYPRSDNRKAEFEPVTAIRDINDFTGTSQEREMLSMIVKADQAREKGENFFQIGKWVVIADDQIIATKKRATKTNLVRDEFTDDQFDLEVIREGRNDETITGYMTINQVGTPATRMTLLAELKQAGLVKFVNSRYIVDARGIILAGTYDYFKSHDLKWFNAIDLNKQIEAATSLDEIEDILSVIKPLEREKLRNGISNKALPLIEAQRDLAILEGF